MIFLTRRAEEGSQTLTRIQGFVVALRRVPVGTWDDEDDVHGYCLTNLLGEITVDDEVEQSETRPTCPCTDACDTIGWHLI